PRPEALPFVGDAVRLGKIAYRARKFDRDPSFRPIGKDVGEKVRKLIDDHIVSLGIDPKVPPVSILDAKFDEQVKAAPSARTPTRRACSASGSWAASTSTTSSASQSSPRSPTVSWRSRRPTTRGSRADGDDPCRRSDV